MKSLPFLALFSIVFLWNANAQISTADSLLSLGKKLVNNAEYEQALRHLKNASKLYLQEEDSVKWIEASKAYGEILVLSGDVSDGLEVLLGIEENRVQALSDSLFRTLKSSIGFAYRQLEQYEKAQKYYLEGIELVHATNDSLLIGQLNNNISYTYLRMGDYETALFHQKKAQDIYEKLGEQSRLSYVLNGIFINMLNLGLYTHAERYIRQSLAIREELGNPRLLDIAYHNLALSFERQGKRDSAIIYYHKSLELSRELGNPFDITQTLNNIGGLYERLGDYDNALAYYNEALEANYQTERPVSISNNLVRLARVAVQNNDFKNAETFYGEALTWLEKANAPQELAGLYLNVAELKLEQGNYAEAKKYVADAKNISRENFISQLYLAHNVLGKIHRTEGKLHESIAEYHKAYNLYANQTATATIAPAANLARVYHELGSDSSFIYAEEAFTLIDSIRTNVAGLTFRAGFFREYAGFYNEVASWYITQKNDPEKAFELIEAAKARVLMDELAEARENVYATLDETTLIKKQQKAKEIDRLYNQLSKAESDAEKSEIRNRLKDVEFEYQTMLNQISVSDSRLRDFKYPKPVSLTQAQEILDSESVILEYAFSENSLVRILIQKNDISALVQDSIQGMDARNFYTEKIAAFREEVSLGREISDLKTMGKELYDLLIPINISAAPQNISNLLIIPGGALTYLPFEVLVNKNRYLIEDYNVKYLPSASIFQFIQPPHRATEYELFALAGSGFEGAGEEMVLTRSQSSYASLPSTLLEVDSIAVNFMNVQILKNEQVTEDAVKSFDLSQFRILHFATHAIVNEQNPSQSGLILSRKAELESMYDEDGFLNSREISGLRFNADLVTLSACNTGMGKFVTGEGLIGLQRSFLSAGASSVLVSLWSIFDRSTSIFMSKFYKQMLIYEKEDYGLWNQTLNWFGMYSHPLFDYKARALRDAKLAMIEHPYYSHPVHWAPFILIGK